MGINQQRSARFVKVGPFAAKEDLIRSERGRVLEGEDGGVKKRERGQSPETTTRDLTGLD